MNTNNETIFVVQCPNCGKNSDEYESQEQDRKHIGLTKFEGECLRCKTIWSVYIDTNSNDVDFEYKKAQ